MHAELESLTSIIRVWEDGKQYGEPYTWVASVRWLNREEVEILGYVKPINREIWKACMVAMHTAGVKRVLAVKYRLGVRVEKWIEVTNGD